MSKEEITDISKEDIRNHILEEFINNVPKHMKNHLTEEVKNEMISYMSDEDIGDIFQEGINVNTDLMVKYSSKPEAYMRAVKFVSFLNIGKHQYEAYALSHPEKTVRMKRRAEEEGWDKAQLRNILSLKGANFKKTRIVTELLARSSVPLAIKYADKRDKAVGVLANLMENAESDRVKMESADRLLSHLGLNMEDFQPNKEGKEDSGSAVLALTKILDKVVDLHRQEKDINPNKSNSSIIEGIFTRKE